MNVLKVFVLTLASVFGLRIDSTPPQYDQWYGILSTSSGKALDVRYNFTMISTFKYSGTQIYQFNIVKGGHHNEREYQIAVHDNGMVISLDYDDARVVLRRANSADSRQLWYVKRKFPNKVAFENKKTGWCLDVYKDFKHEESSVRTWSCGDHRVNQFWVFLKLC